MDFLNGLQTRIFNLDDEEFEPVALEVFRFQTAHNPVYRQYINLLGQDPNQVQRLDQVPFLPIELFKSHRVVTGNWAPDGVFTSSGTGKSGQSKHYMKQLSFYRKVALNIFERFYGTPVNYHFFALLPSYLERTGSSLVHMLNHFIQQSESEFSGFYLRDYQRLTDTINSLRGSDRRFFLWGVSFALLELAERGGLDLSDAIVMETGGMKGQREELIRVDLHSRLSQAFGCKEIQSEYGMAELSSQAYTVQGRFRCPPWMKILIRDINNPFGQMPAGRVGGINIVDLANLHSCAFIETKDLGEVDEKGDFQVLGRMDNSEARGCNLLVT